MALPARRYLRDDGFDVFLTSADITQGLSPPNSPLPVSAGGTARTTGSYVGNQSWTPIDASGAGLVFTSVFAEYNCAANMVFISGRLVYPVNANGFPALIGGLPFSVPNRLSAANINIALVSPAFADPVAVLPAAATTNMFVVNMRTGAQLTNVNLSGISLSWNAAYPIS